VPCNVTEASYHRHCHCHCRCRSRCHCRYRCLPLATRHPHNHSCSVASSSSSSSSSSLPSPPSSPPSSVIYLIVVFVLSSCPLPFLIRWWPSRPPHRCRHLLPPLRVIYLIVVCMSSSLVMLSPRSPPAPAMLAIPCTSTSLADTVGALEGRGGVSPGLLLLRGMVASSVHSSFPSQRAASIGKGFFFFWRWGAGAMLLRVVGECPQG
jgi:hypothetical protein